MQAPPPWTLKGNGYIFIYHFPKEFVEKFGFLAEYQRDSFKGDFVGTVMLVDYETSAVGPYRELLFVPGRMNFSNKKLFSISKIYVSSDDSVWNGNKNWGIPKELADFKITKPNEKESIIEVIIEGKKFFKVHLRNHSFSFPITTKFFPLKLAQKQSKDLLITNSPAKGKASFAKIIDIEVDSTFFPPISQLKPLSILAVKDFEMTFPAPVVLKDYF
ncbi:acetoacetate decarboxylase family protein [Emticicia sp. SJ17W-69]|uniref:acetoacetate decarboxylase family protein n=1 Tax=Emticicia sp. SJ17W-69 TaxID=3421657 RepID=UPI003EBCF17A